MIVGRGWQVSVEHNPSMRAWDVYVLSERQDGGQLYIARPALNDWGWTVTPVTEQRTDPSLVLAEEVAQGLVTALMQRGVRPDVEARNEGELDATKRHLADLRAMLGLGETAKRTLTIES